MIAPSSRQILYGPHPTALLLPPTCISRWFLCQTQMLQSELSFDNWSLM